MKISIIGGGNIGMCLAGEISKNYSDVAIYTSKARLFSDRISVVNYEEKSEYQSGKIFATDNLLQAIENADYILCTLPAFLRGNFIRNIESYVKKGANVGFFPGYGGAEFYCDSLIKNEVTIFALQKVPYISRTKEEGAVAGLLSKKKELFIGTLPKERCKNVCSDIEKMLGIKCTSLENYMEATILPGNPLLHTAGSYIYLKDYCKGTHFKNQIYYYRSWNDECSKLICSMSDEMMEICNRMPLNLEGVLSIQQYYESPTASLLTKKLKSIPSFHDLTLPMLKDEDGYLPNFESRFYTEDIPNGLCILKALSLFVGVQTTNIDRVILWYCHMTGKKYLNNDGSFGSDIKNANIPQNFGLDTLEKIVAFYSR